MVVTFFSEPSWGRHEIFSLKAKDRQLDSIVITGGIVSCHYDKLRCHLWRQICQIGDLLFSVSRVVTVLSHGTGWSQGRHMMICRAVIKLLYSCPFIDACHKVVSKSSYNDSVTVAKSSLRSNIFTESSTSRLKIIFQPSKSCHSSQ